jgi:hypothetical protein
MYGPARGPHAFLRCVSRSTEAARSGRETGLESPTASGTSLALLRIVIHGAKYRTGIAAGSPIPIYLMRQLIEKLNLVDLSIAYGMSEFPFRSAVTSFVNPQVKQRKQG